VVSGVLAALVAGFGGSVLAGVGCAIVAGAADARRRDVLALGVVTAVLGLVGAGAGLVATWVPAAWAVLVAAIVLALATTATGFVRGRPAAGLAAPGHLRLLLASAVVCEALLAAGAWMALVARR
jgi:hypothetical protein